MIDAATITDFRERCEASAHRYAAGELDLHDAVDALQARAVKTGLVAAIGQDIMSEAFRPYRSDLPS